jgi:hypothetical protein
MPPGVPGRDIRTRTHTNVNICVRT